MNLQFGAFDSSFFDLLDRMIDEKYINVQKHPESELFIYNYSPRTQFERFWNAATLQCRGLILDENRKVVARPFPKFFNLEELEPSQVPKGNFDVFEKMDGSLGILYFTNNEPFIATRGSFTSDQAIKASNLLQNKYALAIPHFKKDRTYLFEIIYPENRIVIDYGLEEQLVLLAVIDNASGKDLPFEDIGFPVVTSYSGINSLSLLKEREEDNREGYVIRFFNGLRIKVKFEEYKRLHRILTNVSTKTIWQVLKSDGNFDELLDQVPDEFYNWVKMTRNGFLMQYEAVENTCKKEFIDLGDRKKNAEHFQTCAFPSILFRMLDGKDYQDLIWRSIRPVYEKPFFETVKTEHEP